MRLMAHKRWIWLGGSTLLIAVGAALLLLNHYVWAVEATGLTLTVVSDDTSAAVSDASTTNGKVPVTGGQITYRWGWTNVPGGGNVTFTQTLPAGVDWNAASIAAGCSVSGSYLTTGETLTCTISNLTDIPGTTDKTATVKSMNGGVSITSKLASGSQQSSNVTLTTQSTSQVQVQIARGNSSYMTDAKDPPPNGGTISGLQIPYSMAVYVPGTNTDQLKGQESLGSSVNFSYTLTVPANAKVISCGTSTAYQNDSGTPMPAFGTGSSTATNRTANSGTMTCAQSGSTITVSFSNVDAQLNQVPTASSNYYPSKGIFALGGMYLWMPGTSFNSSTTTQVGVTVNPATFTSASGLTSSNSTASVNYPILLPAFALNTSAGTGSTPPYPGASYTQTSQLSVPSGSGQSATNAQLCQVWDPSLQRIKDGVSQPSYSGTNITGLTAANFTIEYGTVSYADDAARRAADCGTVGDGSANWYSSISAAGGASEVSAARIRYNRSLDPGQFLNMNVTMTAPTSSSLAPNPSNTSGSTTLGFINNRKSDQTAVQRQASGYSGSTTLSTASVRNTIHFPSTDIKPGATTNVTLTPTITTGNASVVDGRSAVAVTEVVTLPNGCFTFVPGTPAPITVSPAAPASPGTGQNCSQVAGQVITWNLGNVSTSTGTGVINFNVNLNPSTPTPAVSTITGVIASNSDKTNTTNRTTTDTINVNTVNQFQVSLSSSSANVNSGVAFTYRAGWKNASSSDLSGAGYVTDVLPYVGDGRGTTGLGSLTVNSVATSPASQQVQYTTDSAAGVQSALASDTSGSTGIAWTTTMPAGGTGITAIRVRTQALTAGAAGYMDISVTPQSFIKGGKMDNDLTAKADDLTSGFSGTEDMELQSSSSTVTGNVYQDVDYSGTKNTGDTAITGKTVTLTGFNFGPDGINNTGSNVSVQGDDIAVSQTTTSDSNGDYGFTVSPGVYTVTTDTTNVNGGNTSNLITSPAAKFEVSGAVTVAGKNFGYQEPINPPVANDDNTGTNAALTIYQGASVTANVLGNDYTYVPTGVPATTIGGLTTPDRGTATLNGDKTVTYTANAVWPGSVTGLTYTASFQYTLTNPQGTSTATVTVTVKRLPFGTTDNVNAKDGQTLDIDALANDYGDTIGFDNSAPPTTNGSGGVSVVSGKLHFVPAVHAWGTSETSYTEILTYHIKDVANNKVAGLAYVSVYRAPVVANDSKTITYNTPTLIDVLSNDLVGKTPGTLSVVSQPVTGTASVSGGNILFTPTGTQTGVATVTYSVTDGLGQSTNGTLTVTVANQFMAVNDGSGASPVRVAQTGKLIDVLANDSGSSLSVDSVGTVAHGTLSMSGGKVQYTPSNSYSGPDSFTYTAKDVLSATQTATVYLKVIAAPVTTADTAWTDTATTKDVDVLVNDTYDPSGVLTITSAPGQGTATVVGGQIHYVPAGTGSTSLTYRVTDDVGQYASGTLTLTIVNVFAANDDGSSGSPIDVSATGTDIPVLANDTGSSLSLAAVGSAAHGTASITSGKIRYVPSSGYSGADSFTYNVTDQVGVTKLATVYVNDIAVPVLTADSATTDSDTSANVDVRANDMADSAAILAITSQPSAGTASIVGGHIVYVPAQNYDGTVVVGYSLTDKLNQSASSTLTIHVTAAFLARDDGSTAYPLITYPEGLAVSALLNDSGLGLHITSLTQPAHGTATLNTAADTITYVPAADFYGAETFTYTVTDTHSQTSTATVHTLVIPHPTPAPTPSSTVTPPSSSSSASKKPAVATAPAPTTAADTPTTSSPISYDPTIAQTTDPSTSGDSILLNDYHQYFKSGGKQLALTLAQVVHFNVERQDKPVEHHTVTIANVGDYYADIVVRSDPIRDRLSIGQTKRYDVNKDGHDDIAVTLRGITDGRANLTFRQLLQPSTATGGGLWQANWWWLIAALVAVLALYGYYRHRRAARAS